MSKIPASSHGHTCIGDPAGSEHELAVLGRRFDGREKRKLNSIWVLLALMAGSLVCLSVDVLIWHIAGSAAYIASQDQGRSLLIGVAVFAGTLLFLRLLDHWRFWPLAIIIGMLGGELTSSFRYLVDSATSNPVHMTTFAVGRVKLRTTGRGWNTDELRPQAGLIDSRGHHWKIHGRKELITRFAGKDCVTLGLRGAMGDYRFVEGEPVFVERPYLDSITGKRHQSRCFLDPQVTS